MTEFETPFPTNNYFGPEYFCDRDVETLHLINSIKSGQSTILSSMRRIGKTGLIKHVFHNLPEDYKGVYIDILPTDKLSDFLNFMASAIIEAIPEKHSFGKKVWKFIKSMRPNLSFDALTGTPEVSFLLSDEETKLNIKAILGFLEAQDMKVVIAIDEFQQIINYPEKNIDAWLRSVIQNYKNLVFIFSGSQQHLLNDLFSNPAKPFYRSASFMPLQKINADIYAEFIKSKFQERKRNIDLQVIHEMLRWTNTHTYYVQLLCSRVYMTKHKKITSEVWKKEAVRLLEEQEPLFYNYRMILTSPQWQLFKAIAKEGQASKLTSKEFVAKHKLGSTSTISRSIESLMAMELVYCIEPNESEKYYSVYDVLFERMLNSRY